MSKIIFSNFIFLFFMFLKVDLYGTPYSLGLGFGDGLGLWLSSGNLLLSRDGLGLGFWSEKQKSKVT